MKRIITVINVVIAIYFFILANLFFWGYFLAFLVGMFKGGGFPPVIEMILAPFLIYGSIIFFRKTKGKYLYGLVILGIIWLESLIYRLLFVTHGKLEQTDLSNTLFFGIPFIIILLTQYLDKKISEGTINSQIFYKIFIIIISIILAVGGFFAWQYFGRPNEKAVRTETKWKEYTLEEITQDFQSANFMDRHLIGIRDDGQRDVIIASVMELMGWEKTLGETGFYPREVSFPPYSTKIFFVKHMAGTAHSAGFFMLDVTTLQSKELTEVSPIYEDYYNYLNIVSPDGFKIASYGNKNLYLLDLLQDKVILLAKAQIGETFYLASETSEFQWLDDHTIQYPVHSAQDIYAPPIEIRQVSIGEPYIKIISTSVNMFIDVESFDLINKTFEGQTRPERENVKILTSESTVFYRTAEPGWEKEYFTFSEFYSLLQNWSGPSWPFTVKGILEEENTIKASEVFYIAQ